MQCYLILDARRKHALSTIFPDNIVFKDDKVVLLPKKALNHSKPTRPLGPLIYNAYNENIKLFLVNCLKLLVHGKTKELVISYGKLNRPADSDTFLRWIKDELKLLRINTIFFVAYSCRSASVSKAKVNGMTANGIMKRGCWKS